MPGSTASTRDVFIRYDLQGHQLDARFDSLSGEGMVSEYDALGRLTLTTLSMDGTDRTLRYGYDIRGVRTSLTHPDSTVFSYAPDTLGRLTTLTQGGTSLRGFTYDGNGRLTGSALGNGSPGSTTLGYDSIGRLDLLSHNIAGTASDVIFGFSYSPSSQTVTHSRDNDSYAWSRAVSERRSYTPNGLSQYTDVGSAKLLYDANGNLINDGGNSYNYDVENRLVGATVAGHAVTARYDPMGRLYEVGSVTGATTRFLYDGDELVAEYSPSGAMLRRYVHGIAVDDPVIDYVGPTTNDPRHLIANRQGSIISILDKNGNLVAKNTYDEYGIAESDQNMPVAGRFAYTGQIWLTELGTYHSKARLYSPTLGRFLQTDPIGYEAGQANLYAYVANDPVNKTDPTGTTCVALEKGKGYDCKVDVNSGKFSKSEVAFVNRAYTAAVNKLTAHPSRSVTVSLQGRTLKTTAGQVASSLISAKVVTGNGTARASTVGGGLTPGRGENGNAVTTINRNSLYSDRSGGTSNVRSDLGRTFIHEGIHQRPVDSVMAPLFRANPGKFNSDHRVPYNNASSALYQLAEPDDE